MSLAQLVGLCALVVVLLLVLPLAVFLAMRRRRHEQAAGGHGPRASRVDGLRYFDHQAERLPKTLETNASVAPVADLERDWRRAFAKDRLDAAERLEREARDQHCACGTRLMFSARERGNGKCGPCTRGEPPLAPDPAPMRHDAHFALGAAGGMGGTGGTPTVTAGGGAGGAGGSSTRVSGSGSLIWRPRGEPTNVRIVARRAPAWEIRTAGPEGVPSVCFAGGLTFWGSDAVNAALGALASGGDATAMARAARAAVAS